MYRNQTSCPFLLSCWSGVSHHTLLHAPLQATASVPIDRRSLASSPLPEMFLRQTPPHPPLQARSLPSPTSSSKPHPPVFSIHPSLLSLRYSEDKKTPTNSEKASHARTAEAVAGPLQTTIRRRRNTTHTCANKQKEVNSYGLSPQRQQTTPKGPRCPSEYVGVLMLLSLFFS